MYIHTPRIPNKRCVLVYVNNIHSSFYFLLLLISTESCTQYNKETGPSIFLSSYRRFDIDMDDKTPHVCMGCGHYSARTDTLDAKWICDVCQTLICVLWRCRRCHAWLGHGTAILQKYGNHLHQKIHCKCFDAALEVDRMFVPTPAQLQVLIENTVKVGGKMPLLHDLQATIIQQTEDELYAPTRSFIANAREMASSESVDSMSVAEELFILQSTGDVHAYMAILGQNRHRLSIALVTDLVVNAILMQLWSVVIPTASMGYDFGTYCTRMGFNTMDVTPPSNFVPLRWCDKPEALSFHVAVQDLTPNVSDQIPLSSTDVWHMLSNLKPPASSSWQRGVPPSDMCGIQARELEKYRHEACHRDTLCDRYRQRWVHQVYKIDQTKIVESAGRRCKAGACTEYEGILNKGPSSDPFIPFTPQRPLCEWDRSNHSFITDKCWLLVTAFARLTCDRHTSRVLVFGGIKAGETSELKMQCKTCTIFCRVDSRESIMQSDGVSFETTACYDSVVSNDALRRVGLQNICVSLNLLTTVAGKLRTLSQGFTAMTKLLRPSGYLIFCHLSLDKIRAFLNAKSASISCRFGHSITLSGSHESPAFLRMFNGHTDRTPHTAVEATVRIKDEEKRVYAWSSASIEYILHSLRLRTITQTPLNTYFTPDTNTVFMDFNGLPDINSFYDLWLVKSTL
jgi:hypothetical protein